ncbi:hypothetical protein FB451DRAFT_1417450 [Mycena latifolia]|nr:hypothetical protein FB451DRAFT_1417450 [Mycena latifolia]
MCDAFVPTSDPAEELLIMAPASDPYEEIIISSYSQRDDPDTRARIDALMSEELRRAEVKHARRQILELELESAQHIQGSAAVRVRKRYAVQSASDDNLDLDLLRLQYNDLEAAHESLKEKYDSLHEEHACLQKAFSQLQAEFHPYKVSLPFFQRELGKWRWAAANVYTRIEAAMREYTTGGDQKKLTASMQAVLGVLRHPDGLPQPSETLID